MTSITRLFALLGIGFLFLLLPSAAQGQTGTVTCSSNDMKYHTCNIAPGSVVRMTRQRSGSPCVAGRTYGSNNGQIWVNNGCRADFEVTQGRQMGRGRDHDRDGYNDQDRNRDGYNDRDRNRDGYNDRDRVNANNGHLSGPPSAYYGKFHDGKTTCAAGANGQNRTFCQTDGAFRTASIQNQNGSCVKGRTWDVDSQFGLWVSGSCSGSWQIQR